MSRTEDIFVPALEGKKIPILTLDNKWHQLFTQFETNAEVKRLEQELNALLKQQGKLNTTIKDIKKLKSKLLNEIREKMDPENEKEMKDHKRLVEECNEKVENMEDELLEIPRKINKVNKQLMLLTMEICYERIKNDSKEIEEISNWINQIRRELKKNVIRKQEKEAMDHALYSYMHDIFGADVIEIFDMKFAGEHEKAKAAKTDDNEKCVSE